MYKLILSYDIHNEDGESVLKDRVCNAVSYPLDEADAHEFCISTAKGRLSQSLVHFLATGFLSRYPEPRYRGVLPEVIKYNYEMYLPAKPIALQYHHTSTMADNKIAPDALLVLPYVSAVKSLQSSNLLKHV